MKTPDEIKAAKMLINEHQQELKAEQYKLYMTTKANLNSLISATKTGDLRNNITDVSIGFERLMQINVELTKFIIT